MGFSLNPKKIFSGSGFKDFMGGMGDPMLGRASRKQKEWDREQQRKKAAWDKKTKERREAQRKRRETQRASWKGRQEKRRVKRERFAEMGGLGYYTGKGSKKSFSRSHMKSFRDEQGAYNKRMKKVAKGSKKTRGKGTKDAGGKPYSGGPLGIARGFMGMRRTLEKQYGKARREKTGRRLGPGRRSSRGRGIGDGPRGGANQAGYGHFGIIGNNRGTYRGPM